VWCESFAVVEGRGGEKKQNIVMDVSAAGVEVPWLLCLHVQGSWCKK